MGEAAEELLVAWCCCGMSWAVGTFFPSSQELEDVLVFLEYVCCLLVFSALPGEGYNVIHSSLVTTSI